jgi:hypothetical protein
MPTRRTLITGAAAAALLTGCGGREPRKLAGSAADIPALRRALGVEREAIAVLDASLPRLPSEALPLARTILAHDREHMDALAQAIRELGGAPSAAPAAAVAAGPATLSDLVGYKQRVAGSYELAIPDLVNRRLRATFGSIMTIEAEHAEALHALL